MRVKGRKAWEQAAREKSRRVRCEAATEVRCVDLLQTKRTKKKRKNQEYVEHIQKAKKKKKEKEERTCCGLVPRCTRTR